MGSVQVWGRWGFGSGYLSYMVGAKQVLTFPVSPRVPVPWGGGNTRRNCTVQYYESL